MSRSAQIAVVLAVAAAGALGAGAFAWAALRGADDRGDEPWGLRLGMGPHDVRTRLARELPGTLVASSGEDLALDWRPSRAGEVRSARFEFHDGKLVAVRARLAQQTSLAHGETLWQSSSAVLSRRQRVDGDLDFLLVARDCPTHRDEVARLLQQPLPSGTSP